MTVLPTWGGRLLYAFLIAKIGQDKRAIPNESMDQALWHLFERLKAGLGGLTKIHPFEAVGETIAWGSEPTTVILVLAEQCNEQTADSLIADEAKQLRDGLLQDEVWVIKQSVQLYIAATT